MAQISHLRGLQALELAVRLGSIKEAALELGITPAAAGQRIKAVEDYLGLDLLVRTRSGLLPTPELSRALPHLRKAFLELRTATDALDLDRLDEIHMAAATSWVELWLKPRLPLFQQAHPNIRFCINGEGDVPMRLGHSDIEVTFSPRAEASGMDILFQDYLVPVSSQENKTRISRLRKKHKLEGFPLLHLDFYKDDPEALDWPRWSKRFGQRTTGLNRGMRFRQIPAGLKAVESNAGMMICGLALIQEELKEGAVVLPFPIAKGGWTSFAYQAKFRADALRRPQVARFREWLLHEAHSTAQWLENEAGALKQ